MGTDAAIFALKAKRYFYYDRDYHLVPACNYSDEAQALVSMLREHKPMTAHQVRDALVRHEGGCTGNAIWRAAILRFVDAHPDDTFVRYTDNVTPSWHDVRQTGGYVEWRDASDAH